MARLKYWDELTQKWEYADNGGGTSDKESNAGTTDYAQLTNKPQINGVELTGNKTFEQLGIQPKGSYALKTEIPKNTSQLTNNSGFLTKHQDITGKADKIAVPYSFKCLTKQEYEALSVKEANTLYFIKS